MIARAAAARSGWTDLARSLKFRRVRPIPAATGADAGLSAALGGYRNDPGTTIARVLTLQAVSPLPPGVTSLTVGGELVADVATGRQPLTGFTFSPPAGTPVNSTVTLAAGQKVQLNLSLRLKNNVFPGNDTHLPPRRQAHGPLPRLRRQL